MNDSRQLGFMDILGILSFVVGLMNLQENLTQGDKQELIQELGKKSDLLLTEIHGHLEEQDHKIDAIMEILEARNDNK